MMVETRAERAAEGVEPVANTEPEPRRRRTRSVEAAPAPTEPMVQIETGK